MRTPSALQTAVLASKYRAHHLRVQIDRDGAGSWVDLSNYEGYNWIDKATINREIDTPTATANVSIWRKVFELNLSPFDDDSKLNADGTLVDIAQNILIETATIGMDTDPESGDWIEVFRGVIDEVDWSSDKIKILARDQSGDIVDAFIETEQKYPVDPATSDDIQDIIQSILDDHAGSEVLYSPNGTAGTPFNAGDSPGWVIAEYVQGKMPVFEAIRRLADQIGWALRYKWHTDAPAFQLQLYDPGRAINARGTITFTDQPDDLDSFTINATTLTENTEWNKGTTLVDTLESIVTAILASAESGNVNAWRDSDTTIAVEWQVAGTAGNSITFTESLNNATMDGGGTLGGTIAGAALTVDYTFGSDDYEGFTKLSVSRQDIRNALQVIYGPPTNRVTVNLSDSASIAKYGRRFMSIAEASSSQIDTGAEAGALARSALLDLKEPSAILGTQIPYFWPAEIGDYYTFEANGTHFSTDQTLAVVAIQDDLQGGPNGRNITTLTLRGQPAGGVKRWLQLEGRPGVAPAVDAFQDEAADNMGITAGVGSITVTYDDPRGMSPPIDDWALSRCYVSTSAVADPPAIADLAATGRTTRFEIVGLIPGTTYYSRVEIVDSSGNVASVSSQVTTATERVGPYHENVDGQQDQLLRNNDFNIWTKGSGVVPDFWTMGTGTWGVNASRQSTGVTGNYALRFHISSGTQPIVDSDYIPLGGDVVGDIVQIGMLAKASLSGETMNLVARWYDSSKSFLSQTSTAFSVDTAWESFQTGAIEAPSSAAYCIVRLDTDYNGATSQTIDVDRVGLVRSYAMGSVGESSAVNFSTSWVTMEYNSGDLETDDIGVTHEDSGSATKDYDQQKIKHPGTYKLVAEIYTDGNAAHELSGQIDINEAGAGWVTVGEGWTTALSSNNDAIVKMIANDVQLDKDDLVRVRATTSIASAAGRFLYLNKFLARQSVRVDQ